MPSWLADIKHRTKNTISDHADSSQEEAQSAMVKHLQRLQTLKLGLYDTVNLLQAVAETESESKRKQHIQVSIDISQPAKGKLSAFYPHRTVRTISFSHYETNLYNDTLQPFQNLPSYTLRGSSM